MITKNFESELEQMDRSNERITALNNFFSTAQTDRIHGLGIKTSVSFADLEKVDVSLDNGFELNFDSKDVVVLRGKDIFESGLVGIDKISALLKEFEFKEKIDYLHFALSSLTLVYIKEDSKIDFFEVERILKKNSFSHIIFYFGKNSFANILYSVKGLGEEFVGTDYLTLIIEDNCRVSFSALKDLPENFYVHAKNKNLVGKDSDLHFVTADFGGKLIVNETLSLLKGQGSNANTDNIFYGRKKEQFDVSGSSVHANENTSSLLSLKGVLEESKAVTRGLVQICDNAPESNGYQKSDIMLLDDKSHAVSIPDLLIHNDQVKCSHGSTISHLEEDKVFYLQSRGLSILDAQRKLVEGFFFPIISSIKSDQVKEIIIKKIEARIYEL